MISFWENNTEHFIMSAWAHPCPAAFGGAGPVQPCSSPLVRQGFMTAMTVASGWPLRLPPALRVRYLRNCSSQHSRSCITISLPWIFVAALYSDQRDWKYDQSSLVPAGHMVGRLTFSTWGEVVVLHAVRVAWSVQCRFRREATRVASKSSVAGKVCGMHSRKQSRKCEGEGCSSGSSGDHK